MAKRGSKIWRFPIFKQLNMFSITKAIEAYKLFSLDNHKNSLRVANVLSSWMFIMYIAEPAEFIKSRFANKTSTKFLKMSTFQHALKFIDKYFDILLRCFENKSSEFKQTRKVNFLSVYICN